MPLFSTCPDLSLYVSLWPSLGTLRRCFKEWLRSPLLHCTSYTTINVDKVKAILTISRGYNMKPSYGVVTQPRTRTKLWIF